jgi:hypothetical protein
MSSVFYFAVTPPEGGTVDLAELTDILDRAYGHPYDFSLVRSRTIRVQGPDVPTLTAVGTGLARWVRTEVPAGSALHIWGQGGRASISAWHPDILEEVITINIRLHAGADVPTAPAPPE